MESRIKLLREKRGLIQEILAAEIGITQQMLSKYEKDITIIKVDVLKRLAEYFNVTTDYLLGISDVKRDLTGQIKMNETLDEYYDLIEVYRRMDRYDQEMVWSIMQTVGKTAEKRKKGMGMEVFFSVTFDAIWMLVEMLVGSLLIIYGESIVEQQVFGSFVSKIIFFMAIQGLRKVFTDEKIMGLPLGHTMLIIFIPIGSIYIMNVVFMMAYRTEWEYVEIYSLVSGIILLVINVLVFYIYIKLADDLQVRRMNLVYEKQLDLCERHQEETEVSTLLVRDVRHGIRNHLIAILAYAEKGECGKLIKFVEDIIEDGKLGKSEIVNTGNIVTDSLTGYWKRTAENEGIEFEPELSIPMEMPFRGADISLIMGNLLENAVEGAKGAERKRYIRFNMKYDKNNLLITVENSYKGKLVKGKGGELRTTKEDVASHGIGLPSVQRAAGKYHGTVSVDDTVAGRFLVRVVLYGT